MKFQSYKDVDRDLKLSYPMVHFHAITKIFDLRCNTDLTEFERAVTALDIIMHGFKDDRYEGDLKLIELQRDNSNNGTEFFRNRNFFDEKAKLLSALVYRVNKEKPRIREYVKQSEIVKEIGRKLLSGFGQNVFITGKTGSGKSYTSIQIAKEVCKVTGANFDINNVVFNPMDFIKRYNDPELTPEGSFLIYEEGGVGTNSRDYQSKGNKNFSKLFQILRHRKILVIINAPDLSFLDVHLRKLLHWWFKTEKVDKRRNLCFISPRTVEVQQETGKVLYPYPVFDGSQMSELRIDKLEDNIADEYEKRAKEFKDQLASQVQLEMAIIDADRKTDPDLQLYIKMKDQGMKQGEIMEKNNWHSSKVARLLRVYKNLKLNQIDVSNA